MLPRASPGLTFSIISNWSSFRGGGRGKARQENDGEDDEIWNNGLDLIRNLPIIYPNRMMKKIPSDFFQWARGCWVYAHCHWTGDGGD